MVARGLVELVPSSRSPLDPPTERPHRVDALPGVAADGTVHFEDRSGPSAETVTPERVKRVLARELDEWARDPYAYQARLGDSDGPGKWQFKPLNPLINAARVADPDAKGTMIYVPLITGKFDVTDEIARRRGHDPDVHGRMRFLGDTREQRGDMAVAERARLGGEAVYRMSERLDALWGDERRSARERRAQLFGLWDECADSDAGRAARASNVGFIRRRLPAGSADAFPAAEIDELNRSRTSRTSFAPYEP